MSQQNKYLSMLYIKKTQTNKHVLNLSVKTKSFVKSDCELCVGGLYRYRE